MELTAPAFLDRMETQANEEQRIGYRRYFPGNDSFIGVKMGTVFGMAKECLDMPVDEIERLLESPIHEARVGACSIMGKAATHKRVTEERHRELYELYLRRHDRIDDWDLVDLAAHQVVGTWLLTRPRDPLYTLAHSGFWPERRSAILATAAFIKQSQVEDTLTISAILAHDPHELVQKGVGWMLRYVSDIDREAFEAFLNEYRTTMPRVMLRAAIEKLPPAERQAHLAAGRSNGSIR